MQTVPQAFGTEAIKRFLTRLLDLAKLDRNNDGNISTDEWGQAVFGLLPELLNIKEINLEVRDLTTTEVAELTKFLSANFPDYAGLDNAKEAVIRAGLNLIGNLTNDTYALLWAIKDLNKEKAALSAEAINTNALPKGNKTAGKNEKLKGASAQPGKNLTPATPVNPETPASTDGEADGAGGESGEAPTE